MNRALGIARNVGALTIAGGIAIEFFIYDVDAGKRAVIFDKLQGVQQVTIGEGTHFRIPYIQVKLNIFRDLPPCAPIQALPIVPNALRFSL